MIHGMGTVFKPCQVFVFTVLKLYPETHSNERSFMWKIMMRECICLALKLLIHPEEQTDISKRPCARLVCRPTVLSQPQHFNSLP